MRRGPVVVTLSVVLLATIGLASEAAPGEHMRATMRVGGHPDPFPPIVPHGFFGHPNFPHSVVPPPFHPPPFPPRPFLRHRVIPFGAVGGPVIVYAPPPASYVAPAPYVGYYNPAVVYDSGGLSYPVAGGTASSPSPSVIQYPTGRYELRGDGLAVPYVWVWIPNPPTAPPAPTAPPSPPAAPMELGDASPVSRRPVYRWTDAQGVLHMTDRWESVPSEYRAQAKPPQPS